MCYFVVFVLSTFTLKLDRGSKCVILWYLFYLHLHCSLTGEVSVLFCVLCVIYIYTIK